MKTGNQSTKDEMAVTLVLDCVSSDENSDDDLDYALVRFTPRYAETIMQKVGALSALKHVPGCESLHEVYFFEGASVLTFFSFYGGDDEFEEVADKLHADSSAWLGLGEQNAAVVPPDFVVPESNQQNAVCVQTVINEDEIWFFCYPKHSDVQVTTTHLPIEAIRKIAAGEPIGQRTSLSV